ncbi:sensor domain-containing protein [Actinokineospora spheciospongiae]|uniref:sensor domain-containing protein n=1 Tax=Actinokineospora spheciospongiae TaxID=909613 RepID=UPI001F2AB9BC|nr:sensor domain-containing protein [Actinokineospora spheciospongiae]
MTPAAVPRPSVVGSLGFLTMNLAVGIIGFTVVVTLFAVGVGTAVVWVGLPVLALAILLSRGGARLERARVYAMLDTHIDLPYPALPEENRWRARVKDVNTYRDALYFLLMLPVGIAEFTVVVTLWSTSLGLVFLPLFYRWLPEGEFRVFDWDRPWVVVDSIPDAVPFALAGVVLLGLTVLVTRGLGRAHARFARALLGPARSLA